MTLRDILPRLAVNSVMGRGAIDAKCFRDLRDCVARISFTHGSNQVGIELGQISSLRVDGDRHHLQMFGVCAIWLAAKMIKNHPVRDRTKSLFKSKAMCANTLTLATPWHLAASVFKPSIASVPNMAGSGISTVFFKPFVLPGPMPTKKGKWLTFDPSVLRIRSRGDLCGQATTALAESGRNGIVRVRHLIASLQAIGGATARSVPTLPGSLRCLHYTKIPEEMGVF
jgi:hypothetical protein